MRKNFNTVTTWRGIGLFYLLLFSSVHNVTTIQVFS